MTISNPNMTIINEVVNPNDDVIELEPTTQGVPAVGNSWNSITWAPELTLFVSGHPPVYPPILVRQNAYSVNDNIQDAG